jgi:hypothetical protein
MKNLAKAYTSLILLDSAEMSNCGDVDGWTTGGRFYTCQMGQIWKEQ